MYPGMMWWWKHARGRHGCGEGARADESGWQAGPWHHGSGDDFGGGGAFGVRRPLRFLAYKLNLNEEQVAQLARILDELKTERAQAAVDDRRTVAAFARAVGVEKFGESGALAGLFELRLSIDLDEAGELVVAFLRQRVPDGSFRFPGHGLPFEDHLVAFPAARGQPRCARDLEVVADVLRPVPGGEAVDHL